MDYPKNRSEEYPPSPAVSESSQNNMSLVDDLPPALSPLSPISPDTLTSVLGGTSPQCDIDNLIGDMTQQEKRGDDVCHSATSTKLEPSDVSYNVNSNTLGLSNETKPTSAPLQTSKSSKTTSIQSKSKSVGQPSILQNLASQPQFGSLQKVLQTELQRSPSAVPHSLLPFSSAATQRIPISSRAAMLQVSFMQLQPLFPATTTSLKDFYHMQSTSMETSRFNQLCLAANTPWLKPSINYYFDLEHHSLIDSLEQRIECLKAGTLLTLPGVSSPSAPLPSHTKLPTPKSSPVPQSTAKIQMDSPTRNNSSSYIVPQALSTPPFMTALPPMNSPGHPAFPWFSPPQRDNCYQQSPQSIFPQPTVSPIPESSGNSRKIPCNKPLSAVAVRVMQNWYDRNAEHPYPTHDTCNVMAKAGGISIEQVKKWFANKRLRNGHTKSIKEIARRRRLPLDVVESKKVKTA